MKRALSVALVAGTLFAPAVAEPLRDDPWVWRAAPLSTSSHESTALSTHRSNHDERFMTSQRAIVLSTPTPPVTLPAAPTQPPVTFAPVQPPPAQAALAAPPMNPPPLATPAMQPMVHPATPIVLGPVSPIPEPSTTALLLGGLGAIGLLYARRRSKGK